MNTLLDGWNILEGLIVTIVTFVLTQWEIKGKWSPIGTALKALIALAVAFCTATVKGLWIGEFTWGTLKAALPTIVGWAMFLYGAFVKPLQKTAVNAAAARQATATATQTALRVQEEVANDVDIPLTPLGELYPSDPDTTADDGGGPEQSTTEGS